MIWDKLEKFKEDCVASFNKIEDERVVILDSIVKFLAEKVKSRGSASIQFICTHNSRRSQLSQVWMEAAMTHYAMNDVQVFSGGTEVTAFHANALNALANVGMKIIPLSEGANPVNAIRYELAVRPVYTFSKTFDHAANPMNSFGAVMNCHHADTNCPYIPNAENRFNLWYGDPGQFDNTPSQDKMYADVNRQIAIEQLYIASELAGKLKKSTKSTK